VTPSPAAAYFAIVAPVAIVSSSGWAWTRSIRRSGAASFVITRAGYVVIKNPGTTKEALDG
jgi:hypothetical protein